MANVSTGKLTMQKGAATMENTLQFLKRQTELLHTYQIIHLGDRKINVQPRNYQEEKEGYHKFQRKIMTQKGIGQ